MVLQSDSVGWSDQFQFQTPPAGGSNELKFLIYGDMGKAPHDASIEHYIQVCILLGIIYMVHQKARIKRLFGTSIFAISLFRAQEI